MFFVKNKGHREHAEFGRLRDALFLGRPKEKKKEEKEEKKKQKKKKKKKKKKQKKKEEEEGKERTWMPLLQSPGPVVTPGV